MIDALAQPTFACGHPKTTDNTAGNGKNRTRCKVCLSANGARWYQANRQRVRDRSRATYRNNPVPAKARARRYRLANPERQKRYYDRSRYGITRDDLAQACEICGATERLDIDHDHATGIVRGRLCRGCNYGIGYFKDDPERLRAAARYLDDH